MTTATRHFHTSETFVEIARSYGLRVVEQAGNYRIERADAPEGELASRRMYVAKQKKACGRVDIAGTGFIPADGVVGFKILGEDEKFCKVNAQLDFTQPLAVTLLAFHSACQELLADPVARLSDKQYTKLRQDARKAAAQRLKELLAPKAKAPEVEEEPVVDTLDEQSAAG